MWFDRENQEKKLLGYLPRGRAYKQAFVSGSNFNNLIKWLASGFIWLVDVYNATFKGMYVCESEKLIDGWRKDYLVASDVFYISDDNMKDIFVMKYLMRGNTEWNFRAIANIYGIDILINNNIEADGSSLLPNSVPHRLQSSAESSREIIEITILVKADEFLPYRVPHRLGFSREVIKIQKIYELIKEAQCKMVYVYVVEGDFPDKLNFCLGD